MNWIQTLNCDLNIKQLIASFPQFFFIQLDFDLVVK